MYSPSDNPVEAMRRLQDKLDALRTLEELTDATPREMLEMLAEAEALESYAGRTPPPEEVFN